MKSFVFGLTTQDLPIPAFTFGGSGPRVLIMAGMHGDEKEGIIAAHALIKRFSTSFSFRLQVDLVPIFNLDGQLLHQRQNSAGVDLNRNLPTNDWSGEAQSEKEQPGPKASSEQETQALLSYIDDKKPQFIICFHSGEAHLGVSGRCRQIAEKISLHNQYEVRTALSYPAPGCLSTYCGQERDIPTLTYEFETDLDHKKITDTHIIALIEALKVAEKNIN